MHVADRVLVLWPGVRPEPLRWESWVQDTGPPGTSQPHVISVSKSSPRDLHRNAKGQLHSTASKLQCWTLHAKQLARVEQNHTQYQRLPKIILSLKTPQNTPPDAVLPTRKTRSGPTNQNTGTSPLHHEAYTTPWTNLTHCRHTPKQWELWTCSLRKGDPKHSNLSKMRRQRNMQQMNEQGKKTTKPKKWRGKRHSTWKRIQNNDSKDDPKSWK